MCQALCRERCSYYLFPNHPRKSYKNPFIMQNLGVRGVNNHVLKATGHDIEHSGLGERSRGKAQGRLLGERGGF